jgi:calcium-independent phospholipase A2
MIHAPYFRLTPQISEDIEIDETSDTKLVNMMWETKAYIHANHTMLKEVAQILK